MPVNYLNSVKQLMAKKERLDKILFEKGFFETKSKAQAAIMAGDVKINGELITKAGTLFFIDEKTQIDIKSMPYVSRGGFKLEKALQEFGIDLADKICLDAGASTGGFTDCMLQNGAKKVYAVDVGYGQIAWKLRNDERVKIIERINIRNCSFKDIYSENEEIAQFCAMDLSFISIKKVIENVLSLLGEKKEIVALIKPQFEAGKDEVGKNGVIKDKIIHIKVIKEIIEYVYSLDLSVINLTYSPIKGPAGNIEYLIYFANNTINKNNLSVESIVNNAFDYLNK